MNSKIFGFSSVPLACILVILMLFSTYPYVFHILFGLPDVNVMDVIFCVVFLIYILVTTKSSERLPSCIYQLMILQSIVWLLYFVGFSDTSYLVRIFFLFLTGVTLYLLCKKNCILKFIELYNITIVIQGILGVIAFILFFLNIIHPIFEYHYSEYRYLYCYGITCSNAVLGNIMRVGGFFDEPGALAYWGVFALLLNKLTTDNKIIEITLIVTLLFTFSAAYFIILPIYLACYYYKNIKSLLLISLILIPIIYVSIDSLGTNSDFAHLTFDRFSGGQIRSTRYDQSDYTKKLFDESPLFGNGATKMENYSESTDNPYEILAKDGVVGFIITYLPLIFVTFKYRKDKRILFGSIILFLDYMQRPFHINEMHYLILYLYCLIIILIGKNGYCSINNMS